MKHLALVALVVLTAIAARAAETDVYLQQQDVVYGDSNGTALVMDIFRPKGTANGLGIVDIASGAWHADRGKIRDHEQAMMYHHFCRRGYTVFAVRPGSVTKYTAKEMLANIHRAIRFIKLNAGDYGVDIDRLGITGASAGGHLALLTLTNPVAGDPNAKDELAKFDTHVHAAGIFFPPVNFLTWGEGPTDFSRIERLLFSDGLCDRTQEEIKAEAESVSPALLIKDKLPPMILFHGDADPLVPLQQSEFLVERLNAVGSEVEFHIKEGGGHPWMTIPEEVDQMAAWFDKTLNGGGTGTDD